MTNLTTWKPVTGGILSIIAGTIHLFGWLIIGLGTIFFSVESGIDQYGPNGFYISSFGVFLFFLPIIALSVMPVIGGIFAIRRKSWGLALAGAICAIISPFTWMLGVASVVLIAVSRQEFRQPDAAPPALSA